MIRPHSQEIHADCLKAAARLVDGHAKPPTEPAQTGQVVSRNPFPI
jgi:hypothetical protein